MRIFAIGVAGFLGAVTRYLLSGLVYNLAGSSFPWGTLAVNISGSFLLGFLYSATAEKLLIDPMWRTAIAIGFVGSYTTFSTFSFETLKLMEAGSWWLTTANIATSLGIGLTAVYLGTVVGRLV